MDVEQLDVDQDESTSGRPGLGALAVGFVVLLVGVAIGYLLPSTDSAAGNVDFGFAQDMTVHHIQAVEMAQVVFRDSPDPQVRALALDIYSTQTAQIGQMQGWLAMWNRPPLPSGGYMGWMGHGSGMGMSTMPGMASEEELATLRTMTDLVSREGLFLQLMLRHHQGGASMLSYATENASSPVVTNFAAQALTLQQHEVDVMTDLLRVRGLRPLDS
ncbi:MAG: hypothetical protein ABS81_11565 [Pseudonocardia sp. SCN 72-86]|nr:MAG: hypothetical protein ABS81_11565 [Pseudonocardia sp. SCN 72-86]